MSQEYRWRGNNNQEEVVFSVDCDKLFVRVVEHDENAFREGSKEDNACVILPEEEIDKMILALNKAKWKIAEYKFRNPKK